MGEELVGLVEMSYQCPLCKSELGCMDGEKMHPNDRNYGVTLYCFNMGCPAQEVMGHGGKEKEAYEVIMAKFVGRDKSGDDRKKG